MSDRDLAFKVNIKWLG